MGPAKRESRRIHAETACMPRYCESMDFGSIPPPPMEIAPTFRRKWVLWGGFLVHAPRSGDENPRCKVRLSDPRRHRICGCLLLENRVGALAWTNTVAWAPIGRAVS